MSLTNFNKHIQSKVYILVRNHLRPKSVQDIYADPTCQSVDVGSAIKTNTQLKSTKYSIMVILP